MASTSDALAGLRPSGDFRDLNQQLISSESQLREFNQSLYQPINLNGLSGRAYDVAQSINRTVLPQLQDQCTKLIAQTSLLQQYIMQLANTFVQCATFAMEQNVPSEIVRLELNALDMSIQKTLNELNEINTEFMLFHSTVNQLISSCKEENDAIQQNQNAIREQVQRIQKELYDKTHTFSGIITSALEALIGTLQGDLQNLYNQEAMLDRQSDQLAITQGGLNRLINFTQRYQSMLEQQQHEYTTLSTNVTLLSNDLSDLMQDTSEWTIGWTGIQDDWRQVIQTFS